MEVLLDPHTAIFTGMTGCGKTERALQLIEKEYIHHFDFIVIICPTLRWNQTYREAKWVWQDPYVILIEPEGHLYDWIKKWIFFAQDIKLYFY